MYQTTRSLLRLSTIALCLTAPLAAQEDLERRMQELERRIAEQDRVIADQEAKLRRLEGAGGEADPAAVEAAVDRYLEAKRVEGRLFDVHAGWDRSFYLESDDGRHRLEIGGYVLLDARAFDRDFETNDTFLLREIRPELKGRLFDHYEFRIQLDATGNVSLRDCFLNVHFIDEIQFKFGQFKEPFSLDQLTGFENIDFLEQARLGDDLVPGRDIGAQLHGSLFDKKLEYAVGVFNGDGINTRDSNDDKDVAGRLVLSPWAGTDGYWTKGIQVGVNATAGEQDKSIAGASFQTAGDNAYLSFLPGTRHDGMLLRYGADFAWYVGPASLKGEWVRNVRDDVVRGARHEDFTADGWYLAATYLVTGETKVAKWGTMKVLHPLDPIEWTGYGAWELAARFGYVDVGQQILREGIATGTEKIWTATLGVNWYFNDRVRVQLDYEYTRFEDDVVIGGDPESDEHFLGLRLGFLF